MTVEELRSELETIVSNLNSAGFDTIDPGVVEKIDKFGAAAGELGMKEGKHLLENLSGAMKAIKEGKSSAGSGTIRLTALDFYVKKIAGGNIEDL
jgi:ABC-type arginine transport system permease subunit